MAVYQGLSNVERSLGIPEGKVTIILTDDFVGMVRQLTDDERFTGERIGGQVLGKCIPQTKDYSDVTVLVNARSLPSHDMIMSPDLLLVAQLVMQVYLVAHEVAHPLLHRIRFLGAASDVEENSTLTSIARALTRTIADEYRADRLACGILRAALQPLGNEVSLSPWKLFGEARVLELTDALLGAYPLWPDKVQQNREYKSSLEDMWTDIRTMVKETLVLLAHAQALAEDDGQLDILNRESLAILPAVRLYIRGPWEEFMFTLRKAPIVPAVDQARADDEALVAAGQAALNQLLLSLGLTLEDQPDGRFAIWVGEPRR
ncbi:MAG: hypothetical protein ACM3XM_09345 [Mycobacterium leprae]